MKTDPPIDDDPFLWLEDVHGERALDWVRARNAHSQAVLQAAPGFEPLRADIQAVLDATDQIPHVQRLGAWLYNLWKDASQPRGLWRRTTLAEYRRPAPAWETVLDLDALAATEGENWVWGGATWLGPEYQRCLLALSRGGADAKVVREFDVGDRAFVGGGFCLPEAKSLVEWIDIDHVFVGTDFGPGSMTRSGYPRVIKRWQRGLPLATARTVFEVQVQDVWAAVHVDHTPGFERTVFSRAPRFFASHISLLQGTRLVPVDKPVDAVLSFWRDRVLIKLRSDWDLGQTRWPQGTLLMGDASAYLKGQRQFKALFTPSAGCALMSYTTTRQTLLMTLSDRVASRLQAWHVDRGQWLLREIAVPPHTTISASALHDPLLPSDDLAEAYQLAVAGFVQPESLQLGDTTRDGLDLLKARPAQFDASGMRVEQHWATSRDGTPVPYFVVWPAGAVADGDNPTLLYGYGGFEVSLLPVYSPGIGRAWTGRGGVFVQANIRGGGEFGPGWHQAAIGANKQRSYDDFAAVAEDLIARKITQPRRLGIKGGSNGGLLVGAVMAQRPELFNAVVCQVPLLDMRRFHRLLAGASWMAEYGDPGRHEDWAWISKYSPYHRLRPAQDGARYPKVLFTTSTRDDRVHPGHARKMAARMQAFGHDLLYWENLEGGHGGAANNAQRAQMMALEYSFLWQQLGR
jgi:prolyl oligopeptidase